MCHPISKNIFYVTAAIFFINLFDYKINFFFKKKKNKYIDFNRWLYVSYLCVWHLKVLNIKLFLFEPNMVLGRSNKFFIKSCEKILCYSDKN